MIDSRLSISSMSYKKKDDLRILTSCLSNWFSSPKILHFTSPAMRYPFNIQQWINQSYSKQSNTLVLKLDNWIIGHISIEMNNENKSAHLFHLIIDPDKQKKGYGKKLIAYAEKYILENDITSISLNIFKKNQVAVKFYKQIGYKIIEKKKSNKIKMLKHL